MDKFRKWFVSYFYIGFFWKWGRGRRGIVGWWKWKRKWGRWGGILERDRYGDRWWGRRGRRRREESENYWNYINYLIINMWIVWL